MGGNNNDRPMGERVAALEVWRGEHRRQFDEFRGRTMETLEELQATGQSNAKILADIHNKVNIIDERPKAWLQWMERIGTVAVLAITIYAAVKYGVERPAAAVSDEVVQHIADESAKRAAEMVRRAPPRETGTVPATLHEP